MTNTTFNAIAERNRNSLWSGILVGAALAVTFLTSALYLPL